MCKEQPKSMHSEPWSLSDTVDYYKSLKACFSLFSPKNSARSALAMSLPKWSTSVAYRQMKASKIRHGIDRNALQSRCYEESEPKQPNKNSRSMTPIKMWRILIWSDLYGRAWVVMACYWSGVSLSILLTERCNPTPQNLRLALPCKSLTFEPNLYILLSGRMQEARGNTRAHGSIVYG